MSAEEQCAQCLGKVFLIAIAFSDHDGNVLRQVRTEGSLEAIDRPVGADVCFGTFRRDDGSLIEVTFDIRAMWVAQGKFTNNETGTIVEPAFAISLSIAGDVAAEAKQFG